MIGSSRYPNAFYRVSLKAIIHNENDEVLVVKERSDGWSLPDGGIDHGETIDEALARELYEEVLCQGEFTASLKDSITLYVPKKEAWALWLVYDVKTKSSDFGVGDDATEVEFMDPRKFKSSKDRGEQLTYKFCVDRDAPFDVMGTALN